MIFFISIFFGSFFVSSRFDMMPMVVAISLTSVFCFFVYRDRGFDENLDDFCRAAGHPNILMMVLIFLLAGIFSQITTEIGSVDSVVAFCHSILPIQFLLPGFFVICSFISLAMGSSMGTVIAMTPIAVGISQSTGININQFLGAIMGGAIFGDNLSFISDTTIAAVRTQECKMIDKFMQNFLIVLPAALITIVLYYFTQETTTTEKLQESYSILALLPYLIVIIGAILRFNVFFLLVCGIFAATVIGLYQESLSPEQVFRVYSLGIQSMEDLSIISILASGAAGMITSNGGLDILFSVLKFVRSQKMAEILIGFLGGAIDLVTANNTVSIIVAGPFAKDISQRYGISGKRAASLLDISSSAVQGLIPYGAQALAIAGFAGVSPVEVMFTNYYSYLMIVAGVLAVYFGFPRDRDTL